MKAGAGVVEPRCAEIVEGGNGGFLRVGNDAVDGFLAVDVGLVFEVAAEGVGGRLKQEAGEGDGKQKHDETGTGGEIGRVPTDAEAAD